MIENNIQKKGSLYELVIKDESQSFSRDITPIVFTKQSIGILSSGNKTHLRPVDIGSDCMIRGSLVINHNRSKRSTIIKSHQDPYLIYAHSDKSNVGIGTDNPDHKLTVRGDAFIYNDSSLGPEILNHGDFSSSSNWDLHMGGFSINSDGYLEFEAPATMQYFNVPNREEPFEILLNRKFTQGQTANTTGQSLYNWHTTGDIAINPSLDGGNITIEHSGGSGVLTQKFINNVALPAASGSVGRTWLLFSYQVTESNIVSGFNKDGTLGDETIQSKILATGFSNSVPLNTNVGWHTTILRSSSAITVTAGTEQTFSITSASTAAGDKIVIKNFSLKEVAGVLEQRVAAMATSGEIDKDEVYKFIYNINNITSQPNIILGTTWLNGLFRGFSKIDPRRSFSKGLPGKIKVTNGSTSVTTTNSDFLKNIEAGDLLFEENFASKIGVVSSITNNNTLVLTANYAGTTVSEGKELSNVIIQKPSSLIHKHNQSDGGYFDIIVPSSSSGAKFRLDNISFKKIIGSIRTENGDLHIGGNLSIGSSQAATDYTLTFDGETNDGVLTWMEDEDYFKFSDDILIDSDNITIGADADGTDRTITFGHSTLKTIMGIDDSADNFIINTDAAFDGTLANNSFTIDASHNVGIGGNLDIQGDTISTAGNIELATGGSGNITLDAAGIIYHEATSTQLTSGNDSASNPLLLLTNTANDATGARIKLYKNRGADGQDGDSCGVIHWTSFDDGTPTGQEYGQIETKIHDATNGQESGLMEFGVANHDGGMGTGLSLTGGSVNDEVDVTIGLGANSVTTVAGDLTVTGGDIIIGADEDGKDRSITFGHSTLKSIIGIDDDQDVFAINTDASFESQNDWEMDSSGNITRFGRNHYFGVGTATGGNIIANASAHDTQGGPLGIYSGSTTAGTTNDIRGGDLTLYGGQGKGTGDGGDIVLYVAPADTSSGNSLNSHVEVARIDSSFACMQQVTVEIDEDEMNALHTTDARLVTAQGSNKIIVPVRLTLIVDRDASTAQASSTADLNVYWDGGSVGGTYGEDVIFHWRRFMYNESGDRIWTSGYTSGEAAQTATYGENVHLMIGLDAAITSGSIDSMKCHLLYYVIDTS